MIHLTSLQKFVFGRLTCILPFMNDSAQRQHNLKAIVGYLLTLGCKVIVSERGATSSALQLLSQYKGKYSVRFEATEGDLFHHTRARNQAAIDVQTELIALWDADVVIPFRQLHDVALRLLRRECDFAYPYDGRFVDFRGHADDAGLSEPMRLIAFGNNEISVSQTKQGKTLVSVFDQLLVGQTLTSSSVGGASLFRREHFIAGGMENERFMSYGPEDQERHLRFEKLGFVSCRTAGVLYHLWHPRGPNSGDGHAFTRSNRVEFRRIGSLETDALKAEVSTWQKARYINVREQL